MTLYQTTLERTYTVETPSFFEEDPPIVETRVERVAGPIIEADNRKDALASARNIQGFAGLSAIGVNCTFCEDRPVANAARWYSATAPEWGPCPRCGVCTQT